MNIDKIVEKILKDCLDVKPRENILVVTDTEKESIGKAIFKKAIQRWPQVIRRRLSGELRTRLSVEN